MLLHYSRAYGRVAARRNLVGFTKIIYIQHCNDVYPLILFTIAFGNVALPIYIPIRITYE